MERPSEAILADLESLEQMLRYHGDRLAHYRERKLKASMELNRARRLKREEKELPQ